MENRWVRFVVDVEKEEMALTMHQTPNKDLRGALIFVPEGKDLSGASLETLRHFRYYTDVNGGCVLLDERTVIVTKADTLDNMLEEAEGEAGNVTGHMPDFEIMPADDECTLLGMGRETYTFRDKVISGRDLAAGLVLRQECLNACEEFEPLAVVWFDQAEGESHFPEA